MPRSATGQVIVDKRRKSPTFALRFNANGGRQYVALGNSEEGWTQARAQDELERELARVKLGTWEPPEPANAELPPVLEQDPTFHEFASQWFEASSGEWREATRLDYEWQLSHHLLPFFKHHRLSQVTIAEVDRYRATKVKQGTLSATSINKTITRLGQVLEVAVEYGLIERNPARGKRRRLKASRPAAVWLDSAEQIEALLAAGGRRANGGPAAGAARRAAGPQGAHERAGERACIPDAGGRPDEPLERSQSHPDARGEAGKRMSGAGWGNAAACRSHASQAQAHVRLAACGDRDRSRCRDGSARPHRSDVHAACLPARDAARR
jgi:hypothetical protein